MRPRILLVLCLICALGTRSGRIVGDEPAEEPNAATKAKISQRDQLGKQAKEVTEAGKFDEATRLLEQVYILEESIYEPANEKLLGTLAELAKVAALQQDRQAVIDIRQRQHRITEQLYGKSDYRTQDAQRAIADAQENATRSAHDLARLQQAKTLSVDAVKLYLEGKYAAAIPLAKQAAEINKSILGAQHPYYAVSLNILALLYKSMGDYPRAEPLYIQTMEIYKAALGGQHPDYAATLDHLAGFYYTVGDDSRAEPLFVQAMEIRKTVLGGQHPDYVASLNNLASLYKSMGDDSRAASFDALAIKIRKAVLSEHHGQSEAFGKNKSPN